MSKAQLQFSTMFCDEVRREANGKLFLIGVYPGDIVVPTLPTAIEQIMLIVKVSGNIDEPRPTAARLRIEIPGQPDQTIDVGGVSVEERLSRKHAAQKWTGTIFIPLRFTISEVGRLRVHYESDVGSGYAGGIYLTSLSAPEEHASPLNLDSALLAIYHYTQRLKCDTQADRTAIAKSFFNTISIVAQGRIQSNAPEGEALILPLTTDKFFILFPGKTKTVRNLIVLRQGINLAIKVLSWDRYCALVQAEIENENLYDGLTVLNPA